MAGYSHLSNKRGVTLTDFEKKIHPPRLLIFRFFPPSTPRLLQLFTSFFQKIPPSTFIDFLDFFHPPLLVYCIYVLFFFKKSHPLRLLILQLLHPLHVYSSLHGY